MPEYPSTSAHTPTTDPRLVALIREANRYKNDIHELVMNMGSRHVELELEPPAHIPGVPGELRWTTEELQRVASAVRAKYAKLQIVITVAAVNRPINEEQQIAALLADEGDGESEAGSAIETAPQIQAITETAPALPTLPVQARTSRSTTPAFGDSSAAADALLKKMGIGVPRKRRPT